MLMSAKHTASCVRESSVLMTQEATETSKTPIQVFRLWAQCGTQATLIFSTCIHLMPLGRTACELWSKKPNKELLALKGSVFHRAGISGGCTAKLLFSKVFFYRLTETKGIIFFSHTFKKIVRRHMQKMPHLNHSELLKHRKYPGDIYVVHEKYLCKQFFYSFQQIHEQKLPKAKTQSLIGQKQVPEHRHGRFWRSSLCSSFQNSQNQWKCI